MSISQFIFVRHGQSQANADGMIADGTSPLTEQGIAQAFKTAQEVQHMGISTIVCSPYLRAQQTAETIAGVLGIDLAHIRVIEELRERGFGACEGKPKSHESEWYWRSDDPGLESPQALLDRMHTALTKIQSAEGSGMVLVVGHAISGLYLFAAAKGVSTVADMVGSDQIGNADFVRVEIVGSKEPDFDPRG